MAFLCRIKQSRLKSLSHQFSRSYFGIPYSSDFNCTDSFTRAIIVRNKTVSITPQRPTEFCNNARFFAAPIQVKPKQEEKDKGEPRLNEKITGDVFRLVLPDGEHQVVSRREALDRARKLNLDLVEVQRLSVPPVCKLMDFNKEKYLKQVKERERTRTKNKEVTLKNGCKEVRFAMKTEQKDLQIKADTVKRMMERGYRVKCMAVGTEEQDLGGLLNRLTQLIEDVSMVESGPRIEKKQAYVLVRHIKFGPSKKGHVNKLSKVVGTKATTNSPKGATSSPAVEASTPNQDPTQFKDDEDLTSAQSESDLDDDLETKSDNFPKKIESTWSVSEDTIDDFDSLFKVDVTKEDVNMEQVFSRETNTEPRNRIQPSPILNLNNEIPVRSSFGSFSAPKESGSATTQQRVHRKLTGNQEPACPGPQFPTRPSFGAFSVPKEQTVKPSPNFSSQEMKQRVDRNPAGVQEPARPSPPPPPATGAAASYGVFSSKQGGVTEERNLDRRVPTNRNIPVANSESGQKPGGWGIFSKENQNVKSEKPS